MKLVPGLLSFFLYSILFLSGMLIDRSIRNYPVFRLDAKLNVLDAGTLLATVAVAFMIPLFVTKLIEDTRGVKQMLIEELKELLCITKEIRGVLNKSYLSGSFSDTDRDNIVRIFNEMEIKVDSVVSQTSEAFGSKAQRLNQDMKNLVISYQDFITGGELMMSSFVKVEERFFRESNTEHSKIETGLKTLMQTLYKL